MRREPKRKEPVAEDTTDAPVHVTRQKPILRFARRAEQPPRGRAPKGTGRHVEHRMVADRDLPDVVRAGSRTPQERRVVGMPDQVPRPIRCERRQDRKERRGDGRLWWHAQRRQGSVPVGRGDATVTGGDTTVSLRYRQTQHARRAIVGDDQERE